MRGSDAICFQLNSNNFINSFTFLEMSYSYACVQCSQYDRINRKNRTMAKNYAQYFYGKVQSAVNCFHSNIVDYIVLCLSLLFTQSIRNFIHSTIFMYEFDGQTKIFRLLQVTTYEKRGIHVLHCFSSITAKIPKYAQKCRYESVC